MSFRTELHWVDVNPHLAAGHKDVPTYYLERPLLHGDKKNGGLFNTSEVARVGTFMTLVSPLGFEPPAWGRTAEGQYVRIPIHAYTLPMHNGPVILAAGFELATRFVEVLRQNTKEEIEALHLVLHSETHSLAGNSIRLYAGVSVEVKGP